MTIKEAVELAKRNDQKAFEYLYNETYKDKYYIALKYMKNEDAANDVLQDSYIKAFSKLDTLDNPDKFPAWLGIIVANTAKNALAKNNPILFSELEGNDEDGNTIAFEVEDESDSANVELNIIEKERSEILAGLLDALSEEQRLCILMFYFERKSISEIAKAFDISENTVKTRLHYGKKNLKKKCEEYESKGYKLLGVTPVALLLFCLNSEKTYAATASASSCSAVISKVCANTAKAAVKKGILASVGAKISLGIAGVAAVAGITVGVIMNNKKEPEKEMPTTVLEVPTTEDTTEVPTTEVPTTEAATTEAPTVDPIFEEQSRQRSVLYSYLTNLKKDMSTLNDGATTKFITRDLGNYNRTIELVENNSKGIFASYIKDFDHDDNMELIVFYLDPIVLDAANGGYRGATPKYIICKVDGENVVETDRGDMTINDLTETDPDALMYMGILYTHSSDAYTTLGTLDYTGNVSIKVGLVDSMNGEIAISGESKFKIEKSSDYVMKSIWKIVDGKLTTVLSQYGIAENRRSFEYDEQYQLYYENGETKPVINSYLRDDENDELIRCYTISKENGYVADTTTNNFIPYKDLLTKFKLSDKVSNAVTVKPAIQSPDGGILMSQLLDIDFEIGEVYSQVFSVKQ